MTKDRPPTARCEAVPLSALVVDPQAQGESQQAAEHMARAYLIFTQLGAERDAAQAGGLLAGILGSEEAANAYLAEVQKNS